MKLIIFLFLFSISLNAQKNTIYLTLQPADLGLGMRYDRYFKSFGIYASATKGNYNLPDAYVKDHIKLASGYILPIDYDTFVTCGLSYHWYGKSLNIDHDALKPVSLEFGIGKQINKLISCIRFDFFKVEGTVEFGIKF